MKQILAAMILLAMIVPAAEAWDNPSKAAAPTISIPKDRPSQITLEARRVKSVRDNTMVYDLGREKITVRADNAASQRFLRDVQKGRTTARETVTLEPTRKSPFNANFKAVRPPSH